MGELDLWHMWEPMGWVAKAVAFILVGHVDDFVWRLDRALLHLLPGAKTVEAVRPAGRQAPQGRPVEGRARRVQAKTYQYSHLAKVVLAGLQEYQFQQDAGGNLNRDDILDTVRRAIQRATALTANDLKKGIPSLATIGATAPFVGLLGTVVGVINAFAGIGAQGSAGLGAVSAGISEALIETALGLVVAIPAVWLYNYFTGRLEYFNVEMDNSSSELVDYFIKKTA